MPWSAPRMLRALPLTELMVALALFSASSLSILLARGPGSISLFWPGSAIAAAVLIRLPRVRWLSAAALLWLSVFLADLLLAHRPGPAAAVFALLNLAEIALMVAAFRIVWRFPYPDITLAQATFMTVEMGVAIPALTALGAGLVLAIGDGRPFIESMLRWWSSHALGACLFGPAIILFSREGLRQLLQPRFLAANTGVLLMCLLGDCVAIRYVRFPFVSISLLLLISAFRVGGLGAALLSLASGLVIIALWALGIRPLGLESAVPVSPLVGLPVIALLATVLPPVAVGLGTDARRAAVRALRSSEQHFRDAIENSPIGILIADLDGTWRHCNRVLSEMLGYSTEELRALPPGGPSGPGEWEASKVRWGRLLTGEINHYDVERRFRRKDGRWIWARVAVSLMRDASGVPLHLIAQIESLEARRDAAQRLAEERQRLITTLQSINDAVITTDAERRLTYINAAAEALLGLSRVEAENRRVDELLHMTDPDSLKTAPSLVARSIASGKIVTREAGCLLHCPDGKVRYIKDSVSPVLGPTGLLAGTVIVLRDVTHEMERERDLQQRASHDSLTGLVARGEFGERMRDLFQKARHKDRPAVLIAIDLDRFKALNDTAGHAAGDAMLCRVAEACRSVVRSSDTVARVGGDEFAMLLENCMSERARAVSEHLLRLLNPLELRWDGATHSVGASIGVAMLTATMTNEQQWLAAADQACYRAKREGRGQVRFELTEG
jgi:diguanylate cyclase (GGDEF)-like protein/PAS domain S-box-containing protein